jgi:formyltetrahydrofolate hydrolase
LLRCVARRGLVSGSQCRLAEAGADIVSLDQHSTQQTGGTFMPRTTFHRPGSAGARDELEFIQTLPTRYATWGESSTCPRKERSEKKPNSASCTYGVATQTCGYLQIVTPRFLERGGLPADQRSSRVPAGAFIGAVPYRRAKELNVKLVVEWHIPSPKISTRWRSFGQDVVRVDHRHSVDDATRLSADVERAVRLPRGVASRSPQY